MKNAYITTITKVNPTVIEVFRSIATKFTSSEIVEFFLSNLTPNEMGDFKKLVSVDRRGTAIKLTRKEMMDLSLSFQNALNHAMITAKNTTVDVYTREIAPDMISIA